MLVIEALSLKSQSGDIGVEIEVEGKNLPTQSLSQFPSRYWRRVEDASLRGECGEYIFNQPLPIKTVDTAIDALEICFKEHGAEISDSFRTGVHVHVNVQRMSFKQLVNYVVLYFIFESSLFKFCRKDRRGNHFCLRLCDAEALGNFIHSFIEKSDLEFLKTDMIRYAGINLYSLFKFGSVEFRGLETPTDFSKIKLWVKILYQLKLAAESFDSPKQIIESFSGLDALPFANKIFKPVWEDVKHLFEAGDITSSMREIQYIAYARNWDEKMNNNIFISKLNLFTS